MFECWFLWVPRHPFIGFPNFFDTIHHLDFHLFFFLSLRRTKLGKYATYCIRSLERSLRNGKREARPSRLEVRSFWQDFAELWDKHNRQLNDLMMISEDGLHLSPEIDEFLDILISADQSRFKEMAEIGKPETFVFKFCGADQLNETFPLEWRGRYWRETVESG